MFGDLSIRYSPLFLPCRIQVFFLIIAENTAGREAFPILYKPWRFCGLTRPKARAYNKGYPTVLSERFEEDTGFHDRSEEVPAMIISGAQAMVNCLEAQGVSVVFGYPGAAICPFYDCLAQSGIRHILVRSEQNAGHAASGYARVAGRPGVCIATKRPGATNLLTALATAYADSIPLVAITGQVETGLLGRDVFQEVDTTGAASPFIKYSYLVEDARDIPRVFREAFYIASTGRPGPVLIDMPVDIQRAQLDLPTGDGFNPRI